MAPKKLTEADKTAILSLYRQPQETTSTLAERYGVSNSTISRLLKASLPDAEYSVLIQQKRGASDKATVAEPPEPQLNASTQAKPRGRKKKLAEPDLGSKTAPETAPLEARVAEPMAEPEEAPVATEDGQKPAKPTRRRSRSTAEEAEPVAAVAGIALEPIPVAEPDPEPTQLSLPQTEDVAPSKPARPVLKSAQPATPDTLEEAAALDDDWDDDPALGDDYDDDDDGDDDDEAYPWESGESATPHMEVLEIAPLTAEVLPSLCYVVVERTSSDLVVLPLSTFADLGQIPESEGDSRTLPVFENHNVARRFSRRNQRVVKVPDGSLLQTTSPYLQAKGITRLFIDGQVFSLGDPVEPAAAIATEPAATE